MIKLRTSFCIIAIALAMSGVIFAGGLNINTNQSASYLRMPARDASTDVDAVFSNPAGLTNLPDGLHFSINNQSVFQKRIITNDYPYLNNPEYTSENKTIFFPDFYAAYKQGNLVYSVGFSPVAGGGSVKFDKGLPSFEMNISDLKPALASKGVTKYSTDMFFEGFSASYGIQGGITYKVDDMLSFFGGVRYVLAKNTIKGALKNNTIYISGNPVLATAFSTVPPLNILPVPNSSTKQAIASEVKLMPIPPGLWMPKLLF